MVNGTHNPAANGEHIRGDRAGKSLERYATARTSLVNCGRDTKITFSDGSTLVLKGVKQVDAVFPTGSASPASTPTPIGSKIGGNR
jgi:hypothetical protein